MTLPNLKELRSILKLCREQGVNEITVGDIAIKFGDLPREHEESVEQVSPVSLPMPSPEEMAFYSALPDPLELLKGEASQ